MSDKKVLTVNRYKLLNVVVVDAHASMNSIIRDKLSALGFKRVFKALNGKDALKIIETHAVDLIISDWHMPIMNGLELLKATRKSNKTANTPFIMLSKNINETDVKQAISLGVSEYLLKPFNEKLLEIKISRAFSAPIPRAAIIYASIKTEAEILTPTEIKSSLNNILIVDDESDNIAILSELLKGKYNLKACTSGTKALEICNNENRPDLILLDIMMPEINGLMVCKALKSNPLTEHIPIIFITALSQTMDVVKGLSLGAVDYITKPISPEITLARISTHIQLVKQRNSIISQLDTMMENMRLKENIERITHHDLQNPLSDIATAAGSLIKQGKYLEQDIKLIAESADLMKNIIDKQMLIHQLENNTVEQKLVPINVFSLMNKVVYGQKDMCVKKNISIKYNISNKVNYLGVESLCINLFKNLLINAIEASPEHGRVTINLEKTENTIITTINNQGVIPEKIQARFFDKVMTTDAQNSNGLNIYSAKLSATSMGGDISFSSDTRNGTSLIVTLKLAS